MTATQTARTFTLTIKLAIGEGDLIAAITSGMIKGPHGYGYWCPRVTIGPRDIHAVAEIENTDEEIARNVIAGGTATFFESRADEGLLPKRHRLTREKLLRGFSRWLVESSASGSYDEANGVTEFEIDAPASDVIIQYALFNEQRYG